MKKILIVDDVPENVFLLQDQLESENYNILTAYDGKAAIEKAVSECPDLILLDIVMPEISGIQVCNTLAENQETKKIPVILVTGKSDEEGIIEGLNAGALDFLRKPFTRIELLARIASAFKLSEAHTRIAEAEQKNTFAATVVTANHRIKQPLTLISLSNAAIKRELNKEEISKEAVLKRLDYIDAAVKEITGVLNQLNAMKKPVFADYNNHTKMIDVNSPEQVKSDELLNGRDH
jgi:DNA-binding response OmpR family regulator